MHANAEESLAKVATPADEGDAKVVP